MKNNIVICKKFVFGYYGAPETKKQWFITDRNIEITLSEEDIKEIIYQFNNNIKLQNTLSNNEYKHCN